jgi:glycosyltransferase involved in cell wall biosynthesis
MKPRVLQLVDSFNEGGSERQALELTRVLQQSGKYEVFLASLSAEGVLRPTIDDLKIADIPSYPLKSFYDFNALRQLARFVRFLRRNRIDLIHTHDFYTNIFGMTAALLAGVKVRIASRRETDGMRTAQQVRAQRMAFSVAHQIVANSESVRTKLLKEGIGAEKITVIYNGLDLSRVAITSDDAVDLKLSIEPENFVTIVANMRHDVKDYPTFLRAAQIISRAQPNTGYLLAGEGELRESIEQLAQQLGIADRTIFLGRCENVAQLLNVSTVCVLSSRAEGFSNSILEYMAAGRPVVATDVGGAREAIVENVTGHLVASGDAEVMAERIIALLRDPAAARQMGNKGREIVEQKFSTAALLKNTATLYDKLLARAVRNEKVDRFKTKSEPGAVTAG